MESRVWPSSVELDYVQGDGQHAEANGGCFFFLRVFIGRSVGPLPWNRLRSSVTGGLQRLAALEGVAWLGLGVGGARS